jgi:hypothetical protein
MKKTISILSILFFLLLPKSSFAIVYNPTDSIFQDSLQKTEVRSQGDKIAFWGLKSTIAGTLLVAFALLMITVIEFEMRGGFLLILTFGSFITGPILALLGLILCLIALNRKDTTKFYRKKARTGLWVLLFSVLAFINFVLFFND